MRNMDGKVVAVTGASSGIGAELAVTLAENGAIPVLIARRADKLAEVAARIRTDHLVLEADVTVADHVERIVAAIIARYGRIDGWVNNAGVGLFERFVDMKIEDIERQMNVNYMSVVHCTKAVLPHMLERGRGNIVNVVSVAGKLGSAKAAAYSASKHAALGFSTSLRQELTGTGVYVSTVNPGPIDTPFFDIADPSGNYRKNVAWFMLKPQTVVAAIMRALKTGKADITLPLSASVGAKALQIMPNLLAGLAATLLGKK